MLANFLTLGYQWQEFLKFGSGETKGMSQVCKGEGPFGTTKVVRQMVQLFFSRVDQEIIDLLQLTFRPADSAKESKTQLKKKSCFMEEIGQGLNKSL